MRSLLLSAIFFCGVTVPVSALAASHALEIPDANARSFFLARGILQAELDGSVTLSADISRAAFVKTVVEYVFPKQVLTPYCLEMIDSQMKPGIDFTLLFADVSKDAPYALHLCVAMRNGMIGGYTDATFRPNQTINFAEAAKVLNHAFAWEYHRQQYASDPWSDSYILTLQRHIRFPDSVRSVNHRMTVGETQEILTKIGKPTFNERASRPLSTSHAQGFVVPHGFDVSLP